MNISDDLLCLYSARVSTEEQTSGDVIETEEGANFEGKPTRDDDI
jgi:hypothetical protein